MLALITIQPIIHLLPYFVSYAELIVSTARILLQNALSVREITENYLFVLARASLR
jgi:hypothetical protein